MKCPAIIKESQENTENIAAVGGIAFGSGLIRHQYSKGGLTGREILWHNTKTKNIESILNKGLWAKKSLDPKNIISRIVKGVPKKQLAGKVYFGRDKKIIKGLIKQEYNRMRTRSLVEDLDLTKKDILLKRTTLKAKAPVWKMNVVINPETGGATTWKEFKGVMDKRLKKQTNLFSMQWNFATDKQKNALIRKAFRRISDKGTLTIKGDVPANIFIKSKHYKRLSIKELLQFIRAKPKRFAKGIGISGIGLGIIGIGGSALYSKLKEHDKHEMPSDS